MHYLVYNLEINHEFLGHRLRVFKGHKPEDKLWVLVVRAGTILQKEALH